MLDRAIERPAAPAELPTVRVSPGQHATVVRMKSWLPEQRRGSEPIKLGQLILPRRAGTTSTGPIRVLCVAPSEWLLISETTAPELLAQLQPSLHQYGLSVTDASDGLATFVVEGALARTLLSKGCGLDLHPQPFPAGRCARTRFAQLPVILECLSETTFEVSVARSYASYLHAWLVDAAAEWVDATR